MRRSGQKGGKRWERGEKEEENVKTRLGEALMATHAFKVGNSV